jgi:predicted 2-oxoglutarate/Fe(II)-dependent dioxygenase YbiX
VFNTLLIRDFLDEDSVRRIVRNLNRAESAAAGVYGRGLGPRVEDRTRKAELVQPDAETAALVERHLREAQPALAKHFGVKLTSYEMPQFVRYPTGGFFVAHQDGHTPLIADQSAHRRVSVVIFLNARSEEPRHGTYGGGDLTLHGTYPQFDRRHVVPAEPGTLVAFPSETTHEVTPVTHGVRYTIVSWYRDEALS